MSLLCQFYVSSMSAYVSSMLVLCLHLPRAPPEPQLQRSKNITRDETPMPLQNCPCGAHTVRGACSLHLGGGAPATDEVHLAGRGGVPRGAAPAADAEGDCLLGLVLVLSLARLLVDRPRRGPPGAKRLLRLRCCASAAAPRCVSLASCLPRSPLLWVSFNATPCIKLCLSLAGGGLAARRLAVCCLRLLERNGRWDGRPRAGLAARTFHPPIPIGAKNCVLPCVADVLFFLLPALGAKKKTPWVSVVHGAGVVWQRFGSVRSALGQR